MLDDAMAACANAPKPAVKLAAHLFRSRPAGSGSVSS